MILFPFREDYYVARALDAAMPGSTEELELTDRLRECRGRLEIAAAKNRQGPTGTARVHCNMGLNRITDIEDGEQLAA